MQAQEWTPTTDTFVLVENLARHAKSKRAVSAMIGVTWAQYVSAEKKYPQLITAFERGFSLGGAVINERAMNIARTSLDERAALAAVQYLNTQFEKVEEKLEFQDQRGDTADKLMASGLVSSAQIEQIKEYWAARQGALNELNEEPEDDEPDQDTTYC